MPDTSASSVKSSLSKEELESLAMSLEKYKDSLEEYEKIESEILKEVMNQTQATSKEEARKHLHNLLASQ